MTEICGALEDNTLTGLCLGPAEVAIYIQRRVKPDDFSTRLYQRIAQAAATYITEFKQAPGPVHIRDAFATALERGNDEGALLARIFAAMDETGPHLNWEKVRGDIDAFLEKRRLERMVDEVSDALAAGQLEEAKALLDNSKTATPRPGIVPINWAGWQGKEVPPMSWVAKQWIPRKFVTMLSGAGGFGKSLLSLQLMTAAALGRPWVGVETERVRCLGVFCEDDEEEIVRRQAAVNRLYGCSFLDIAPMVRTISRVGQDNLLASFSHGGKIELTPFYHNLKEEILDFGAELVIFDPVASAFGGDPNSMVEARRFVEVVFASIALEINGAVVFAAHPSRSGMASGEGTGYSVQWENTVRSRAYLIKPSGEDCGPNDRALQRKKANYASIDVEIALYWDDGILAVKGGDADQRPDVEELFLTLLDTHTETGRRLSYKSRAGNYAPKVFAKDPGRSGWGQKDFADAMERLFAARKIMNTNYYNRGDVHERIIRTKAKPPPNGTAEIIKMPAKAPSEDARGGSRGGSAAVRGGSFEDAPGGWVPPSGGEPPPFEGGGPPRGSGGGLAEPPLSDKKPLISRPGKSSPIPPPAVDVDGPAPVSAGRAASSDRSIDPDEDITMPPAENASVPAEPSPQPDDPAEGGGSLSENGAKTAPLPAAEGAEARDASAPDGAPAAEIRLPFKYKARSQESWERAANLRNPDRREDLK